MSAPQNTPEDEVRLYADACSGRFVLKSDRRRWVKEFHTLPEAIRFVTNLPREGTTKVVLLDEFSHPLTEFFLRAC